MQRWPGYYRLQVRLPYRLKGQREDPPGFTITLPAS